MKVDEKSISLNNYSFLKLFRTLLYIINANIFLGTFLPIFFSQINTVKQTFFHKTFSSIVLLQYFLIQKNFIKFQKNILT